MNTTILKYTTIIYTIMFLFGVALTLIFRKTNWGRNMFVATVSWFVLFILFIGTSFISSLCFTLLILTIAFLAIREYYMLNGICKLPEITTATLLLICMAGAIIMDKPKYFYTIPVVAALLFFPIQLFKGSPKRVNLDASLLYMGFIYWGWLFFHITLLHRLSHGFGYIIFICSLIALNDNSAYFTGKLLGKNSRKLAPRISPSKTWIGTIGGSIATACTAFIFWYTVPHLSFGKLMGLVCLIAVAIPMGDLIESAMKRDIGVKDSGNLIPGHGGVMDRFDTCVFTVPIMYYYILLVT